MLSGAAFCLVKPIQRQKLHEALSLLVLGTKITPHQATPLPAKPIPLAPPKLSLSTIPKDNHFLAVDDNFENLKFLQALLEEMGMSVTCFMSGSEILAYLKEPPFKSYEAILLDIQMPKMDGIAVVKAIRTLEKTIFLPTKPIFALTAHAVIGEREKLLAAGFDDYLSKPLDYFLFKNMLERAVQTTPATIPTSRIKSITQDMFDNFIRTLPQEQAQIYQAFLDRNRAELRHYVHRLHGVCCYCNVPRLKLCLSDLEDHIETAAFEILETKIHFMNQEINRILTTHPIPDEQATIQS
jgi:two-component system sensor histidine kinase BarA